jgi:GAF domain/Pyridoxamine 5'-phosphate oxidase
MTSLRVLRRCFEGAVPACIATCALDGTPNVAKLSHVHYLDDAHVALSYQFFNKTRENILHNGRATVEVLDPETAAHYILWLQYLRTETAGPLFENMKARLAAIASHTGMSKVFRLLGSDVYRVLDVEAVPGDAGRETSPPAELLSGLRGCIGELSACADLEHLLGALLEGLERRWDIRHSMLLMPDRDGRRLYTVATRGYPESGVGSEVCMGEGIVGVAAAARTPIRIGHAVQEYRYSLATRQRFAASADGEALETEIPFPGLPEAGSQIAVSIVLGGRLLGVLYVESPQEQRFTYEDEDAFVVLADHLALCIDFLSRSADQPAELATQSAMQTPAPAPAPPERGVPVQVRHFPADNSVFVDNDYLIKGVAGAIIWKLLREHAANRTT